MPDGGSLLVLGLGPIGDMVCRIAQQKWIDKIIAVDLVDERLERARAQGLMSRRQLTADQAFTLLKCRSQNTNVKLRTIAQTVIQTGDLPVHHGE